MANANKFELPNVEGIYVVSLIGKGHFSRVYKGVQLKDKAKVAIKVIEKKDLTKAKVDDITSEIGIMKSLSHPNVVKMMDFKWDSRSVYIILEYCEGGNLCEYIKLKNRLKESVCMRALQQLASGLQYIRSKNICHMDLKPQNILIQLNPFTVKIADFGLAQYIPDEIYKENLRGSPLYMAPEILLAKKYNYKVDLWSVGIILYECLYGRPPLAHKSCKELLESLKNEMTIKYPSTVPLSRECKDLLERLLTYDPDKRIDYDEFFKHPFIDLAHAPTEESKKLAFKIINEAVKLDENKDYTRAFNAYCRALRYFVPLLETMAASNERAYLQLKITEYLTRAEELKTALYMDKRNNETMQRNWASQDRYVTKDADSLKRESRDVSSFVTDDLTVLPEISTLSLAAVSFDSITYSSRDSHDSLMQEEINQIEEGQDIFLRRELSNDDDGTLRHASAAVPEDMFLGQNIKDIFASSPKIRDSLDIGFSGQIYMMQGDYDVAYLKYEAALKTLISEVKNFPSGIQRDLLLLQIKKWLTLAENVKTLASIKTLDCSKNVKSGMEVMDRNCSLQ